MTAFPTPRIILASSSEFRKSLLQRLNIPFTCFSPEIDESRLEAETATEYVCRLSREKAQTVARANSDAIVIGSDQCAVLNDEILGKPGTHANALQQLRNAQGRTVAFHTGLCVLYRPENFSEIDDIVFEVDFRQLSDTQLEHYLRVEEPYQCAGSFKSEGYGISLFQRLRGDDPTALIGLPLIRLVQMLEKLGVAVV